MRHFARKFWTRRKFVSINCQTFFLTDLSCVICFERCLDIWMCLFLPQCWYCQVYNTIGLYRANIKKDILKQFVTISVACEDLFVQAQLLLLYAMPNKTEPRVINVRINKRIDIKSELVQGSSMLIWKELHSTRYFMKWRYLLHQKIVRRYDD